MIENLEIVIGQRGFVWVGNVDRSTDRIVITNAQNIRRWGTTWGLGQLAIEGPQPNTRLDKCGIVTLHFSAEIAAIKCDPEKWKNN